MGCAYRYHGNEGFLRAVEPRLEAAGFTAAADGAEVELVVSFCTSTTHLEDLYFGEEGIIQNAPEGAVLLDLSPTTPSFAREMNAVATVSDRVMVEAPFVVRDMTASDALGRDNLLCFMADEQEQPLAVEFLEALCGSVRRVGTPGSGQLLRAACTLQATAYFVSVIEADALYRAQKRSAAGAGVDEAALEMVSASAARIIEAVAEGRFEGDYTAEMLMAGLASAIMGADDAELILPQAEAALHLLELLCVIGGADKAPAALALVYGDEAAGAAAGLDWARAEQLYAEGHDHGEGDDDDWDACDGFDDDDGYDAGFGYSSN